MSAGPAEPPPQQSSSVSPAILQKVGVANSNVTTITTASSTNPPATLATKPMKPLQLFNILQLPLESPERRRYFLLDLRKQSTIIVPGFWRVTSVSLDDHKEELRALNLDPTLRAIRDAGRVQAAANIPDVEAEDIPDVKNPVLVYLADELLTLQSRVPFAQVSTVSVAELQKEFPFLLRPGEQPTTKSEEDPLVEGSSCCAPAPQFPIRFSERLYVAGDGYCPGTGPGTIRFSDVCTARSNNVSEIGGKTLLDRAVQYLAVEEIVVIGGQEEMSVGGEGGMMPPSLPTDTFPDDVVAGAGVTVTRLAGLRTAICYFLGRLRRPTGEQTAGVPAPTIQPSLLVLPASAEDDTAAAAVAGYYYMLKSPQWSLNLALGFVMKKIPGFTVSPSNFTLLNGLVGGAEGGLVLLDEVERAEGVADEVEIGEVAGAREGASNNSGGAAPRENQESGDDRWARFVERRRGKSCCITW